ncbi:MAG: dTMP kinase [Candidatus Pacebacteria bacterium]|nr:dTMP kinase [Candidatus Paceibacterota bacterium]
MKKNSYSGKFIAFEGLDGSGLSTQAGFLKNFLMQKNIDVILTKEPTKNSSVSEKIQEILTHKKEIDPFEFQKLFARDREEHLKNLIIPALKQGRWVISDRYFFSSFAFGARNEEELKKIIDLNKNFLMPDLAIFLKVAPEVCVERIKKRGEEVKLFEKLEKLRQVFQNYQILKERYFSDILVEVNGEGTIEEIQREVMGLVVSKFNLYHI